MPLTVLDGQKRCPVEPNGRVEKLPHMELVTAGCSRACAVTRKPRSGNLNTSPRYPTNSTCRWATKIIVSQ